MVIFYYLQTRIEIKINNEKLSYINNGFFKKYNYEIFFSEIDQIKLKRGRSLKIFLKKNQVISISQYCFWYDRDDCKNSNLISEKLYSREGFGSQILLLKIILSKKLNRVDFLNPDPLEKEIYDLI